MADGDLFGDLGLERAGLVSPSFRVSVHRTLEIATAEVPLGHGILAWTYGRAEACPLRFAVASSVALRPCVVFDAGVVSADGEGPKNARSVLGAWAAPGALARADWMIPLSPKGWALALEAQGGLVLPIVRKTFIFEPSSTVYQAPVAMGLASVGAGVRFP